MANNFLYLRTLNSPYVGNQNDITRGSVLSHNDVDNNFIFLKGEDILTATTTGTTIIFDRVNSKTINVDIGAMINGQDTFTTGSTLVGSTLVFNTTDALSAYTADLSPLLDDTNFYATGATLYGQTIYVDRTDTLSAFTIDISGFIPTVDYGNIIFVSENGGTGQNRNDVIGNINKPVSLEWASQIAQSGDTIHVKSGIYNLTTTGNTGLSVNGVNHYFEPNTKVYKTTNGPIFTKGDGIITFNQANVYGSGSFYGSDSCGYIFYNNGDEGSGYTQVYEWDICENSSTDCYKSSNGGNTKLTGKQRIISSGGDAIGNTSTNNSNNYLIVDCPEIISTISVGIKHNNGGTEIGFLRVNSNNINGAIDGLLLGYTNSENGFNINSNYINTINISSTSLELNLMINANRVDIIKNFYGKYLNVNGHLGWLLQTFYGIADVKLIDRCWIGGIGTLNTTFNGDFIYTGDTSGSNLILAAAGNITSNIRLNKSTGNPPYAYDYVNGWWFSVSSGRVNLLGNWDLQDFWYTQASGVLNIPNETTINLGPIKESLSESGETFNLVGVTVNISGTIIERCDQNTSCDISESATTYSNTLMFINDWGNKGKPMSSTRVIYNGATIIVRNQNSQLITTPVTGGTIGIYTGGLNTNKINSFQAEKEKRRISVTGTTASYSVNGETYTCTTGSTAAECALELTSLTNTTGTPLATASQDNPGVDEYFYIESDIAGEPLIINYINQTSLDVIIRYNTKAITENVGGTLIENANITRDYFN